jgi:hypothetical protein
MPTLKGEWEFAPRRAGDKRPAVAKEDVFMSFRVCVLAMLFVVSLTLGGYAMILTLSLEELTASSRIIAVVTHQSSEPAGTDPDLEVPLHKNTLVIGQVLKGDVKPGDKIVVETTSDIEDSVVFDPNGTGLAFLVLKKGSSDVYVCNNLVQGFWPMTTEGQMLGMGTGTTLAQVEEAVKKTGAVEIPRSDEVPEPEF